MFLSTLSRLKQWHETLHTIPPHSSSLSLFPLWFSLPSPLTLICASRRSPYTQYIVDLCSNRVRPTHSSSSFLVALLVSNQMKDCSIFVNRLPCSAPRPLISPSHTPSSQTAHSSKTRPTSKEQPLRARARAWCFPSSPVPKRLTHEGSPTQIQQKLRARIRERRCRVHARLLRFMGARSRVVCLKDDMIRAGSS